MDVFRKFDAGRGVKVTALIADIDCNGYRDGYILIQVQGKNKNKPWCRSPTIKEWKKIEKDVCDFIADKLG